MTARRPGPDTSGPGDPAETPHPPERDALAAEIAAMGYEQARDGLVEVVRSLENGSTTLEESLALWERGEALARRCEEWLDGARARMDAALAARESSEA